MIEKRRPISVNEAIERVEEKTTKGTIEYVPIETSYGNTLGTDLVADHPIPPFNKAAFDGYAIRSIDTDSVDKSNPIQLEVIGEIGAGSVFEGTVGKMQAVRIMTGAQMPDGCDAVEMIEAVKELHINERPMIEMNRRFEEGGNVSYEGEDTKKGEVLASKGTYINPGIVALLATFGYKDVPVSKKPKVGIIATGSELLAIDEEIQPGKIRNSNAYMIYAQVERAGGKPIYYGQFEDDFETCFKQVSEVLEEVDMLITTGGVSVGDYDYLPDIYEKLEANVLFNKVGMRPGSVTTVAEKNGKLLFGLSGNPSACYVGFELFTRLTIRKHLDSLHPFLKKETAVLGIDFPKTNPFDRFVRGKLSYNQGKLIATPNGLDKSNVVSSLGEANCLIVLPGGTKGYEKEMEVEVILLEDQEGAESFYLARKGV